MSKVKKHKVEQWEIDWVRSATDAQISALLSDYENKIERLMKLEIPKTKLLFETEISFSLPRQGKVRDNILQELNKIHFGKPTMPLQERFPQEHPGVVANVNVNKNYKVNVLVGVSKDGSLHLVQSNSVPLKKKP